jgi:hypothetical protein
MVTGKSNFEAIWEALALISVWGGGFSAVFLVPNLNLREI